MKTQAARHTIGTLTAAVFAAAIFALAAPAARAADLPKLMVFDTEFHDLMMSGTGESFTTAEDVSRAKTVSDMFRKELAGHYQIITPKKDADPYDLSCPECILKVAKDQGAALVLTSALSRMNSRNVYLKYELGDVAKNERLAGGNIQLNGYTARQINMATNNAVKDLLTNGGGEKAAAPK